MKYSIVIPFFNEEDSVIPLCTSIASVMNSLHSDYELILVNDGSTDTTMEKMKAVHKESSHVVIIDIPARSGQTAALNAGFTRCQGEIIFSLDGDLQDDPRNIPLLLETLENGYDVVCGWRYFRNDSLMKKNISLVSNKLQNLFLHTNLHDISCTLRAYRNYCLPQLRLQRKGMHRFIPYLLQSKGYRIAEVKVTHQRRIYGHSKYNLTTRALKVIADFIYIIRKRKDAF